MESEVSRLKQRVRANLAEQIERASCVDHLVPLLTEFLTLDELKDTLHSKVDDEFDESKLRSSFLRCSPLTEVLPSEVLMHCLSFLDPRQMNRTLMCVSKSLNTVIRGCPIIFHDYTLKIDDNPEPIQQFLATDGIDEWPMWPVSEPHSSARIRVEHRQSLAVIEEPTTLSSSLSAFPWNSGGDSSVQRCLTVENCVTPWFGFRKILLTNTDDKGWESDSTWRIDFSGLMSQVNSIFPKTQKYSPSANSAGPSPSSGLDWMFEKDPMHDPFRSDSEIDWDRHPTAGVNPSEWFESYQCASDTGFVIDEKTDDEENGDPIQHASDDQLISDTLDSKSDSEKDKNDDIDDDTKSSLPRCKRYTDSIKSVSEDCFDWRLLFEVPWKLDGYSERRRSFIRYGSTGKMVLISDVSAQLSDSNSNRDKRRSSSINDASRNLRAILAGFEAMDSSEDLKHDSVDSSPDWNSLTSSLDDNSANDEVKQEEYTSIREPTIWKSTFYYQLRNEMMLCNLMQPEQQQQRHTGAKERKNIDLKQSDANGQYIEEIQKVLNAPLSNGLYIPPDPDGKSSKPLTRNRIINADEQEYSRMICVSWDHSVSQVMSGLALIAAIRKAWNGQAAQSQSSSVSSTTVVNSLKIHHSQKPKEFLRHWMKENDKPIAKRSNVEFIPPSEHRAEFTQACRRFDEWKGRVKSKIGKEYVISCLRRSVKSLRSVVFAQCPPNHRLSEYPFPFRSCIHLAIDSAPTDDISQWLNTTVNFPRLVALDLCGLPKFLDSNTMLVSDEMDYISRMKWTDRTVRMVMSERFRRLQRDKTSIIAQVLSQCQGLRILSLTERSSNKHRKNSKSWHLKAPRRRNGRMWRSDALMADHPKLGDSRKSSSESNKGVTWTIPSTVDILRIDQIWDNVCLDLSQVNHLVLLDIADGPFYPEMMNQIQVGSSTVIECLQTGITDVLHTLVGSKLRMATDSGDLLNLHPMSLRIPSDDSSRSLSLGISGSDSPRLSVSNGHESKNPNSSLSNLWTLTDALAKRIRMVINDWETVFDLTDDHSVFKAELDDLDKCGAPINMVLLDWIRQDYRYHQSSSNEDECKQRMQGDDRDLIFDESMDLPSSVIPNGFGIDSHSGLIYQLLKRKFGGDIEVVWDKVYRELFELKVPCWLDRSTLLSSSKRRSKRNVGSMGSNRSFGGIPSTLLSLS